MDRSVTDINDVVLYEPGFSVRTAPADIMAVATIVLSAVSVGPRIKRDAAKAGGVVTLLMVAFIVCRRLAFSTTA